MKNIVSGYANMFFGADNILENLAKERLRHCISCTLYDNGVCSPLKSSEQIDTGKIKHGCGCVLKAKALSYSSECPLHKWKAELTPDELLLNHEDWMMLGDKYTNGDVIIEKRDKQWVRVEYKNNVTYLNTLEEFKKSLNNE